MRDTTTEGPLENTEHRNHILSLLPDPVKPELEDLRLDRGVRSRLLPLWSGDDYFTFYLSNEIPDGFHCGFVIDLDIKGSPRKPVFKARLMPARGEIEEALGLPMLLGRSDRWATEMAGIPDWIKIMGHMWYSLYHMHRLTDVDIDDSRVVAEHLRPTMVHFAGRTRGILEVAA